MRRQRGVATVLVSCLVWTAWAGLPAQDQPEADRVKVQHLLISFKGRSGRYIDRSKQEAEALALDLLRRAREGESFDALVKEYTDDAYPGVYVLVNRKIEPLPGEVERYDMVKSFGDVSFSLDVGEIGLAEYHATRSPYGWHVILRLE